MLIKIDEHEVELYSWNMNGNNVELWFSAPLSTGDVKRLEQSKPELIANGDSVPTIPIPTIGAIVRYGYLFAAKSELEVLKEEFENVLADARAGLVKAPVPGEDWEAEKWYRAGDGVKQGGAAYECVKTCKGREPKESPLFWKAVESVDDEKPIEALVWEDIASGTDIAVGTLVTHADKNYRCVKEHKKSLVRQVTNTDFWEAVST